MNVEGIILTIVVLVVTGAFGIWWNKKRVYQKAKDEIFVFVKSHKVRCTGINRFVVTVPFLQDSFREYNTDVIEKIWQELVNERVIQQDAMDNEWCIK